MAGQVLHQLLLALPQYLQGGLEAFHQAWQSRDLMLDKEVMILQGTDTHYGVARGIDSRGLLLVENEQGIACYSSGEVSLRAATT